MVNEPILDANIADDPKVRLSRERLANLDPSLRERLLNSLDEYLNDGAKRTGYARERVMVGPFMRYQWFPQKNSEFRQPRPLNDVEGLAFLYSKGHKAELVTMLAEISTDQAIGISLLLDLLIDRAATALDAESVDLAARIQSEFEADLVKFALSGAARHDSSSRGGRKGVERTGRKRVRSAQELHQVALGLIDEGIDRRQWTSEIRERHGAAFGSKVYIRRRLKALGFRSK